MLAITAGLQLLIVVVLVVAAWRSGWSGWALIPPVVGIAALFVLCFMFGVVCGIAGIDPGQGTVAIALAAQVNNMLTPAALGIMIGRGRTAPVRAPQVVPSPAAAKV